MPNRATPIPPCSTINCAEHMPRGTAADEAAKRGLSEMALGLVGSEILKIAAQIREMVAAGETVCNLTVGDFAPTEFPIPQPLQAAINRAYERRETNYPPSDGVLSVRQAVQAYYRRELGLDYPLNGIVIAGGARPAIYATYRALLERGERVIYPTPSWNNNHYCHLMEATGIELPTTVEQGFMPTAEALRPLLSGARLLCLNSPLNPTGTVMSAEEMGRICDLVLAENRRRQTTGERELYIMFDQVYWMLTFGDARHHTPIEVAPDMAAYTIFVDGISKSLAATGLRVGWLAAPPHIASRMRDILGHVGAWAPRPEQIATGEVLADENALAAFHQEMTGAVRCRLDLLYEGFQKLKAAGLSVDAIPPQGAIYLSVCVPIHGRRTPEEHGGEIIETNEDVRRYLLDAAGMAVVPFRAFGTMEDTGWMRLSVGAVSPDAIRAMLPRLETALRALR